MGANCLQHLHQKNGSYLEGDISIQIYFLMCFCMCKRESEIPLFLEMDPYIFGNVPFQVFCLRLQAKSLCYKTLSLLQLTGAVNTEMHHFILPCRTRTEGDVECSNTAEHTPLVPST